MAITIVTTDKDNSIFVGDPTDNDGTNVRLFLTNLSNNTRIILLNFTIPSAIVSSEVTSANLLMTMVVANPADASWIAHRIVPVWAESTSTWEDSDFSNTWTTPGAGHIEDDISNTPTPKTGTVPNGQTGVYNLGDFKNFVTDAIDNRSRRLSLRISKTGFLSSNGQQFHSKESIAGSSSFPHLNIFTGTGGGAYAAMSHANLVTPKII